MISSGSHTMGSRLPKTTGRIVELFLADANSGTRRIHASPLSLARMHHLWHARTAKYSVDHRLETTPHTLRA
jgi:hypothetical protein